MAFSVYCPVQPVTVFAGSSMLDDMGQFTKYVLWAIGAGFDAGDISQAIELQRFIVDEELSYLERIGFLRLAEEGPVVSETGRGYLELMRLVESFNQQNIAAQLNLYSGDVSQREPGKDQTPPEEAVCLPERTSLYLVQNRNYIPLVDHIHTNHKTRFSSLRPEVAESLYYYLKLSHWREKRYHKMELTELPSLNESLSLKEAAVLLERQIEVVQYRLEDERLMYYRNALKDLERLEALDTELLSPRAMELLAWYRAERRANREVREEFYDGTIGEKLMGRPAATPLPNALQKTARIQIPPAVTTRPADCVVGETVYRRVEETVRREAIVQVVPFSRFREVEV